VRDRPFPYLRGWICLNGAQQCEKDTDRLNILYVKLAIGGKQAADADDLRYGSYVKEYFMKYCEKSEESDFPHDSTTDIFYSDDQYRAYRDLGYDLAKCIRFTDSGLSIDHSADGCRLDTAPHK
jgi:hypothetical protein